MNLFSPRIVALPLYSLSLSILSIDFSRFLISSGLKLTAGMLYSSPLSIFSSIFLDRELIWNSNSSAMSNKSSELVFWKSLILFSMASSSSLSFLSM